jgi:hypothetical protein
MAETSQGATQVPEVTDEDIKGKAPEKSEGTEKDTKSTPKNDSKAPAKKEKGPGPWQAELEKRGLNTPEYDAYHREVLQPYITELESRGGNAEPSPYDEMFGGDVERAQMASELMQAFIDDPQQAIKDVMEILEMDPSTLLGQPGEMPPPGTDPNEMPPPPGEDPLANDPRLQWAEQEMQRQQEAQEDAEYEELLTELGNRVEGFDPEGFNLAVLAAQGDMDKAFKFYMDKIHKEPAAAPPQPDAPVLDSHGGTAPPPAFTGSLDDAVNSTMADMKAARSR